MSIARVVLFGLATLTTPFAAPASTQLAAGAIQSHSHLIESPSALVEQVRRATEALRDVRQATAAGYAQFLGCVSGPQEGAMGVHFVNGTLVGDGAILASQPEALIYEFREGLARLVGVEYIVMADDWNRAHKEPPVLEGQTFQFNSTPNRFGLPAFYELHVWAWRDNPKGTFADWNINVSCEGQ